MDIQTLNEKAKTYDKVLNLPWNVLGYEIRHHNLAKHLAQNQTILDIGGGNGQEAIQLVQQGHNVHILDISEEMLKQAQEKLEHHNLQDRFTVCYGSVEDIPKLFDEATFDVVLCHNVLQYLPDIAQAIKAVAFVLKEEGFSSVICLNKYSEPLRLATQQQDIFAAKKALYTDSYVTAALGLPVSLLSAEDIFFPAKEAGLKLSSHYGIRCVNDYVMDNATKTSESILDLELELTAKYPYYLIARFFQLILRRSAQRNES